ncbi:Receptor-type tyrosine-protein phosphatase T [Holothuria leucospilota]|uniref:protein-tyrosine-phosphatase n=1 Tax=Holothuria leucospilota TaxID=206669 RepID=A0A9Q1CA34_HOLLE|nr:Receptor-type tyrosine-protein phosphatase T [Holothuria leucospilota]
MTLLSIKHYESEADGQYQCHLSDPDKTSSVTSFRTVDTRSGGDSNNPDPPATEYPSSNKFPHHKVTLNDNGTDKWFGVFGCEATRTGKEVTRISVTRMRSDADFVPVNKLFTQTVNIGDTNVAITMSTTRNTGGIRWRKDGSVILSQSGSVTFSLAGPIQLSDAGTYECHYTRERDMAKQGLNLLLVRACEANRWDPPGCTGVCDSCYNGGICDENNGKCVCAPGFMGENCLQACGGNKYGHTCEIRCSSKNDEGRCGSFLFCLVHPFGCTCNTGWNGLACETACQGNTFGASCLQTCHCASDQCDRYRGTCTGSDTRCKPGWTGDNCQECDGNYFGTDCSHECRCAKENCNRELGLCKPGACLPRWVDLYPPYTCQTGLKNITYTKMNPGVQVPVTCQAVEGPGGDLNRLQLVLSKSSESLEDDDITVGDRSQDGTARSFMVTDVQKGDMLHCQLRNESGKLAVLSLSVEVFDLPVLTSAPVNISVNGSSVTIRWSAWEETTDVGDPPLVGYVPYYKVTEENDWVQSEMVSHETLIYTFTSLNPETYYLFSVSAVRAGEGGEGPKSPELSMRTICDVPSNPENVMAEISGENQENIEVSWQLPLGGIDCSSGVIKFTVYYSWWTNLTSVDVTALSATSVILYGLSPGVSYTMYVTLSTSGGESGKSDEMSHLVPVQPSLTSQPTLPNNTCNSITMVWARWTAGRDPGTPPITHYIPYYKMNVSMEWMSGEKVDHSSADEEYSVTFYNLTENAQYDFSVVPVREGYGGEGRVTNVVNGNTTICFVHGGSSPVTIAVSTTLSVLVILLLILATVMIIVRRREKRKPLTTDYEISGATNNTYIKNINEPESFSKNVEQTKEQDEGLYTNLEKPESIVIADLDKYMRDCESSNSGKLEQQFKLLNGERQFASHTGNKEQNRTKNRFKNMIAYDHSRVILEMIDGDPHSDYYNANYIKNIESEVAFIASQGPNKASVGDFWRMLWKENVCNIVMLTNLIEDGKDRCIQYWPPTVGATKRFGEISLKWKSDEQFGDYNIRELQVKLGENIRSVTNWHFKTWPDKNVPDQPSPLIEFARRIKTYQKTAPGHLLVHCSAGVGRTGTFIALYTLMDVIDTNTKIDIYGYVEQMRQDRIKMVQTETKIELQTVSKSVSVRYYGQSLV